MSDGIKIYPTEDGRWDVYDDTYDIVIHCTDQEEQEGIAATLRNCMSWHDVSKELPEKSDNYLVTIEDSAPNYERHVCISYCAITGSSYIWSASNVKAWMEMPVPFEVPTPFEDKK
jgi:hypothetical protein